MLKVEKWLKRFCGKNSAVALLALSVTAQCTKDSKFAVRISQGHRVQNCQFQPILLYLALFQPGSVSFKMAGLNKCENGKDLVQNCRRSTSFQIIKPF